MTDLDAINAALAASRDAHPSSLTAASRGWTQHSKTTGRFISGASRGGATGLANNRSSTRTNIPTNRDVPTPARTTTNTRNTPTGVHYSGIKKGAPAKTNANAKSAVADEAKLPASPTGKAKLTKGTPAQGEVTLNGRTHEVTRGEISNYPAKASQKELDSMYDRGQAITTPAERDAVRAGTKYGSGLESYNYSRGAGASHEDALAHAQALERAQAKKFGGGSRGQNPD